MASFEIIEITPSVTLGVDFIKINVCFDENNFEQLVVFYSNSSDKNTQLQRYCELYETNWRELQ